MTDQREMELVSASLDGELNGDEKIELDSLLSETLIYSNTGANNGKTSLTSKAPARKRAPENPICQTSN